MGNQLTAPLTTLHIDRVNHSLFRAAAATAHGWRTSMEDAHNILTDVNDQGLMLFGVYDGHGGPLAAQFLQENIPNAFKDLDDISDFQAITKIMLKLDNEFLSTSHDDGTTVCIVLAQPWDASKDVRIVSLEDDYDPANIALKLVTVNLGDSRAMIIRKDGDYTAITEDHKPDDPVELNRITDAGGFVRLNRVDGQLALSRAIGDRFYKDNLSLPPERQKVIAVPDYQEHFLHPGEILLVACDGIFEVQKMTHEYVANFLRQSIRDISENFTIDDWDPAVPCRDIIDHSLEGGSHDNHSAMVIHFSPNTKARDLPAKECIPGPFNSVSPDDTYIDIYKTDLSHNDVDFDTLKPVIDAVDLVAEKMIESGDTDYTPLDKLPNPPSVRPIISISNTTESSQPDSAQVNMLLNLLLNNRSGGNQ